MTRKAQPPKASDIVRYWLSGAARRRGLRLSIDPAEPSCFACAWWDEAWKIPGAAAESVKAWDHARGLERAHLVPEALGGPATVDNFVVLCWVCHLDAPNFRDGQLMIEWLNRRPHRAHAQRHFFNDLIDEIRALGITAEQVAAAVERAPDWLDRAKRILADDAIQHAGEGTNPATMALIAARALGLV